MESITLIEGVKIAIYGFITVFIMLSLLMFIIMAMSKIVDSLHSKQETEVKPTPTVGAPAPAVENEPDLPKQYVGQIILDGVDEKTAACIMAIISEETQIPLENLIFKSIRLIEGEN